MKSITAQSTAAILVTLVCAIPLTRAAAQMDRDPLAWMEQKVTASDGTQNSYFGSATALDGATALIGADGENSFQGAAYIFTESNGDWQQTQQLMAKTGQAGDEFGYRTALLGDTAVIGAFSATVNGNTSQGAAYVFNKTKKKWREGQELTANDGAVFDNFGAAVAISADTIAVGANGATVGGNPAQGTVYVFNYANGIWSQTQKLTANDGASYDNFGLSVALDGSTILVGSPRATIGSHSAQGAVYVFTNSGGIWSLAQKLTSSDGAANDGVGQSVALENNIALVGAYFATVNSHSGQGAAYIFTRMNNVWSQTQKLTSSQGEADDYFGNTVALDGKTALIGADGSTVGSNTDQGKAYLFAEKHGNWKQSHIFTASDGVQDDFFGAALALDNGTALVSTPHPTIDGNTYQGAGYFFEQSAGGLP